MCSLTSLQWQVFTHYITLQTVYSGLSKSNFNDHYGDAATLHCPGMIAEINEFSVSDEILWNIVLQQLQESTEPSNDDFSCIGRCLSRLGEFLSQLNSSIECSVLSVSTALAASPPLLKPRRRFQFSFRSSMLDTSDGGLQLPAVRDPLRKYDCLVVLAFWLFYSFLTYVFNSICSSVPWSSDMFYSCFSHDTLYCWYSVKHIIVRLIIES